MNMNFYKRVLGTVIIPLVFLLVLLFICQINGRVMIANQVSFTNFVIYAAIIMITTIALSINLNSGRFDFSLGSIAVLSSVISSKISYALLGQSAASAFVMFILSMVIGGLLGFISGRLYNFLRIPPIITSLGVTLIYEGITYTITSGKYMMAEVQTASMSAFISNWVNIAVIVLVVLAVIIYIFNLSKFGAEYRALKNGQKVAVNTGIKEVPNAIWCYVICGILMGIVGFLNAGRNMTINGGALNFGSISIMFTAFLPMFIGGFIGRYSNEYIGYLLAGICMSLLNSTFAVFANEITASMQSIINALLLVVFLIYLNNEGKIVNLFTFRWLRRN